MIRSRVGDGWFAARWQAPGCTASGSYLCSCTLTAGGDYGPVTLPVSSLRAKVHSSLDTIQSPSPAYEAVKSLSKVVDWPVEAKISKQVREISWLVDM